MAGCAFVMEFNRNFMVPFFISYTNDFQIASYFSDYASLNRSPCFTRAFIYIYTKNISIQNVSKVQSKPSIFVLNLKNCQFYNKQESVKIVCHNACCNWFSRKQVCIWWEGVRYHNYLVGSRERSWISQE